MLIYCMERQISALVLLPRRRPCLSCLGLRFTAQNYIHPDHQNLIHRFASSIPRKTSANARPIARIKGINPVVRPIFNRNGSPLGFYHLKTHKVVSPFASSSSLRYFQTSMPLSEAQDFRRQERLLRDQMLQQPPPKKLYKKT